MRPTQEQTAGTLKKRYQPDEDSIETITGLAQWPKTNPPNGEWQLTPSSHYSLTKDDFAATDWQVIKE